MYETVIIRERKSMMNIKKIHFSGSKNIHIYLHLMNSNNFFLEFVRLLCAMHCAFFFFILDATVCPVHIDSNIIVELFEKQKKMCVCL